MDEKKIFMIVDDDADDRFLFTQAVGRVNGDITVLSAESGKQLFEYLSDESKPRPDIIFLDINMVEMNGWDCLNNLKKNQKWASIPVIMYSTSSSERDIQTARELGAESYCVKPDDFNDQKKLVSLVAENLHGDLKRAINTSGLKCVKA